MPGSTARRTAAWCRMCAGTMAIIGVAGTAATAPAGSPAACIGATATRWSRACVTAAGAGNRTATLTGGRQDTGVRRRRLAGVRAGERGFHLAPDLDRDVARVDLDVGP